VEALRGVIEVKLADSSLYLSSIVLIPSSPSSSITILVFCMICMIGSFPTHHPCIYLRVSAQEPILYASTVLCSSFHSLKSYARASVTHRELCAVPRMANTKVKNHAPRNAKHQDFDQSNG
jgi:hypothetical protein